MWGVSEDKRTRIGPTGPLRPVTTGGSAAAPEGPPPPHAPPTPAAPPDLAPSTGSADPMVGKTLDGRYQIQKKLGEGGMAAVYLATHHTLGKQVALKVLHGELARKPDLVERFIQEARSASRIRHENVIDISDFGHTAEGLVFFAMELLTGHDLHEEIARARLASQLLPWERSKRIFLQICAALTAAHALGIVHRDLKPENIYLVEFLGEPDFVKLLDFGIAKLLDVHEGDRKLTRTGMLFGTPEYMSPEQARGDSVDARVDVYAMGCILFQLVTGRVPFEHDNFMGVLSMHLTEPPPVVPADVLASIGAPRELADVIAQALRKDRNQRFASIDELARAVRRVSGDQPTGAGTAPPGAPAPPGAATLGRAQTAWTGTPSIPASNDPRPRPSRLPVILGAVVVAAGIAAATGYVASRDAAPARGGAPAPPLAAPVAPVAAAPPPPVAAAAPPAAVPPPPAATPPALGFERAQIRLVSTPASAEVQDMTTGAVIGHTPLSFSVPASRTAREFVLHRKDYVDAVVELVTDRATATYTEQLRRGASASTRGVHTLPPATPAHPAPAATAPTAPDPATSLAPAAPAPAKPPTDDCGDPPCLKTDPSRPSAVAGSASEPR